MRSAQRELRTAPSSNVRPKSPEFTPKAARVSPPGNPVTGHTMRVRVSEDRAIRLCPSLIPRTYFGHPSNVSSERRYLGSMAFASNGTVRHVAERPRPDAQPLAEKLKRLTIPP